MPKRTAAFNLDAPVSVTATVTGAYRSAANLSNATVLTIPMAEHTTRMPTPCGNALVQSLILDPEAEINLGRVEAARPIFVGPDEDLPK